MLFFPFRVDLNFNRIPLLTILVCVVCVYIFIQQGSSFDDIEEATTDFCEKDHERMFWIVIKKVSMLRDDTIFNKDKRISDKYKEECKDIFYQIHSNKYPEKIIDEQVGRADKFSIRNEDVGIIYIRGMIEEKYREFRLTGIEKELTAKLMYEPHSYHLGNMITAVFAHADWEHLLGNLFFFFAFAASIEMILGMFGYVLIFGTLAIGTHLSYSLAMVNMNDALPTLGLSGVVMGMIGVFVYLMPKVNIRCFLWFFVIFRIVQVPAWILAVFYVSWDVAALYLSEGQSGINFISHISGAMIGFGLGALFLVERKEEIQREILAHLKAEEEKEEQFENNGYNK